MTLIADSRSDRGRIRTTRNHGALSISLFTKWGTHLFYELAKSWRSSTRPRNPDLDRGLPPLPRRSPSLIRYSVFLRSRAPQHRFLSALLSSRGEGRSFSSSGTILTSHRAHVPQTHDSAVREQKFPSISATKSHLEYRRALSHRSHSIHDNQKPRDSALIDHLDPPLFRSLSLCITPEAIGKEH